MANIFSVSNADELMTALASAAGGDTIELTGGDYGALALRGDLADFSFDSTVTIVSANPDDPAVISRLDVREASNIKFDNLMFDYQFSVGHPGWMKPFEVRNSDSITFSNSSFRGDFAEGVSEVYDGFGNGFGLVVSSSENITVEDNHFESWGKGLIISGVTGANITGNELTDMREDGMNLIRVENTVIENNYIHDFRAHSDDPGHRDMIQLWVLPDHGAPSSDVTIRGNVLDVGDGVWTQGIFMRNGAAEANPEDTSMYWQNITIENNTIYGNHVHGIYVGETINLNIANNSLLQAGEGGSAPHIRLVGPSESVLVEKNIAGGIIGYSNQDSWELTSNIFLPLDSYTENFVTSSTGPEGGAHNFILLPDVEADQLGAGSEHIRFPDAPDSLTPLFQVYSDPASDQTLVLDASLTVGPLGLVSEEDAEFLWNFGDGSTATGRVVHHEFSNPGYHDVNLIVTNQDGVSAEAQFRAGIVGSDIAQFDAQTGQFEALAYGEQTAIDGREEFITETPDGQHVLKLG